MTEVFLNWWSTMAVMEHVYWMIALPSSLGFVFYMAMTFVGGDMDGDMGFDGDMDAGIPFQFMTLKNLVGFFAVFSWTGLAFIKGGYDPPIVIMSSTIAGTLMMLAMSSVYYMMSKLTESGNVNLNKAVGSIGEVYLVIKGRRKAMGKVQLKVEGTFQTLNAITDDENDISTGALVDVIDVTNNNILIVKSSSK